MAQEEINNDQQNILDDPSNEDLSRLLNERLGSTVGSEPASTEEEAGEQEPVNEQVNQEEPAPSAEDQLQELIDLGDGRKLSKADAARYAQFEQYLIDNPEFTMALQGLSKGDYQLVPVQQQQQETKEETPPELDLDDPNIKWLHDQLESTRGTLTETQQKLLEHEAQLTTQSEATINSVLNRAKVSFQNERSLSDDEMNQVYELAGSLNVLPSLMAPNDPITGLPRKVDPLDAVEKALEMAYWTVPEFREKEVQRQLESNRADNERKRKMTSLGGSGGSTKKDVKAPTTKQEINAAMAAEIAAAMTGQNQGE